MNVSDKWMLEQMQQMAANMAASLPQTGQNSEAPKNEKGETFQDLMDKAKDQQVETPKKTETPKAERPENVQKTEQPRKAETVKNADGTVTKKVNLTLQEAALVAAGYAALSPVQPDGTVWLAIAVGEGSVQSNPLVDQVLLGNQVTVPYRDFSAIFVDSEWVVEPSDELMAALEQLLAKAGDPRSAGSILSGLEERLQNTQPKIEIVVSAPETDQADSQEDETNLDAEMLAPRQPLFKDVKAAPVKVGENFRLDTEQPEMDNQLADAIRFAAQQGLKQIEIRLSPENLGNLTIRLTQAADGTLEVVLHTANNKAASLLNQHLDSLNQALQAYGQTETRVEVQRSEDSQQAQHQQADPDGHNRQQQQQQQRQEHHARSEDFLQRLRLGLFSLEDVI